MRSLVVLSWVISVCYGWGGCLASATGAESRFAVTNSRGQYVHWIELYDADGRQIDRTDSAARPYS
ncbi:MAG: hypothetical protein AB7O38_11590, partial [Pirellulaceae bacterium]